jgi:hypothetical protein
LNWLRRQSIDLGSSVNIVFTPEDEKQSGLSGSVGHEHAGTALLYRKVAKFFFNEKVDVFFLTGSIPASSKAG